MSRAGALALVSALQLLPALGRAQGIDNPIGANTIEEVVQMAVRALLGLVGVVAVGFIVWGGFSYVMSGGDSGKISQAKATITFAITGLIFVGLAYAIVEFIYNAFGGGGSAGGATR